MCRAFFNLKRLALNIARAPTAQCSDGEMTERLICPLHICPSNWDSEDAAKAFSLTSYMKEHPAIEVIRCIDADFMVIMMKSELCTSSSYYVLFSTVVSPKRKPATVSETLFIH